MIQFSYEELLALTSEDDFNGRFSFIHNDIPLPEEGKKWRSSDYIEDDGRQYRYCKFIEVETQNIYYFNYVYYPDDQNVVWTDNLENGGIQLVEKHVELNKYVEPKEVQPESESDRIKREYQKSFELGGFVEIPDRGSQDIIPESEINLILKFLKQKSFSYNQLVLTIYPVLIKYKVEQKSLWKRIQVQRGIWK